MHRKSLDFDEIFDTRGIRMIASNLKEAYRLKEALLSVFMITPDHVYHQPGQFRKDVHPSVRDTLQNPEKTHRAIRMVISDRLNGDVFEVQITTKELQLQFYQDPVHLAETIRYHAFQPTTDLQISESEL